MNSRTARAMVLLVPLASPATAGVLAHWKLDGTPAEETGWFPAVWNGPEVYTPAVAAPGSGTAAELAESWLKAGAGIDFQDAEPFSATAWIKGGPQDSAVVGDMIQGNGYRGWELHVGTTENGGNAGSVTIWLIHDYPANAIQVNASVPVLDNQWHHVAFTYDGSRSSGGVAIYIDGVPVPTAAGLDSLGGSISNGGAAELNIGTRMNGALHDFSGAIDEVAIFDHALAPEEMATLFSSGVEAVATPVIVATVPSPGQKVASLESAEVIFSLPVTGVDAGDLLVNAIPASGLEVIDPQRFRFTFPAPPAGDVHFSWANPTGIAAANGNSATTREWSATLEQELPQARAAIAEFLARNVGGAEDEDHDTPDWIELVNPGSVEIDLGGWTLSDDPARPDRWVLPSFTLQPGARRLIFASGKDRRDPAATLHTNFSLSRDGGYLALAHPSGEVAHAYVDYPPQEANVSLGLEAGALPEEGRGEWRFFTPTPGSAPAGLIYSAAGIGGMSHFPAVPQPGEPVTVLLRTVAATPPDAPPQLRYRVMHGPEMVVTFADDGLHGDGAAGDHVWGAVIPAGATAGQMIRWRATLFSAGLPSRWPVNRNAALPLPIYDGTVVGGAPAGGALPTYQIFAENYTFPTGTSQSGVDSDAGARAAFFGNGTLHDNVLIRIKGTTSRYLFKRSHRVDFNPGREFAWSPDYPPQREVNLNSEYVDPSYLRQNLQMWMHRDSGGAGAPHFPVKLLMNGETWQLAFHTYPADGELLEVLGLDDRGALYKQVGTLNTSSNPEKKTRRWENNSDYVALREGLASFASAAAKSRYVHDHLNLPAVINYLAVARIAHEGDDVWANMVVHRDSEGTGEWRPVPFDLNLSFGQLFYAGNSANTVVQATNDANKSHPLYGSSACLPNTGQTSAWNRLYDAIIQNPATRAMLLRRIRTLTDRYLGPTAAASPLEGNFELMAALIGPEADVDRARWGWPPNSGPYGLGPDISPAQGLATLKSQFLAPRRTHFLTTHSVNNTSKAIGIGNSNNAGIPDPQAAVPLLDFGDIDAHPASGNQDEEFIEIVNPGATAVDVSDWTVRSGGGFFTLDPGTVIPPGGSLFVSPDVVSFRGRTESPRANENRFVVGPFHGRLSPFGDVVRLELPDGSVIAQATVSADPDATPVELAVTEILSSSVHGSDNRINGDWWELTNVGSAPVDLAGLSWDDSRDLPGQAVFPSIVLAAGESAIILDEDDDDEAAAFRDIWSLPASVKILTREDFNLPQGFRGLGNGDSVIVYLADGTGIARADYPAHLAGISRAWHRNGTAVPGGYSEAGKFAAVFSGHSPADLGSPGFAAADPATLTDPYDIWAATHDLWSGDASPSADLDGDGRDNRSEYLFGGSPRSADTAPPQSISRVAGAIEWTFTRRGDDPTRDFYPEASGDLEDWEEVPFSVLGEEPHPALSGYLRTTYVIEATGDLRFFRVRGQ